MCNNYLKFLEENSFWAVMTALLIILSAILFYWLWETVGLSTPLIFWLLTFFVVIETVYFVLAKYFLDNPKFLNIFLSFVLCALFFFIKNEVAGTPEIGQVLFYRIIMAVLDVFLVFAGTVIMDLLFEWLKRRKLEREQKKKAEKKKVEAEKDGQ